MKVLSLFDGISCGMVALHYAGITVDRYVAYEIDDSAIAVSKKNWSCIEHCGDVFKGDFTQYKGFDLLIGGSPCTYWSIAGARGKGAGSREVTSSGFGYELFSQYVRALHEAKPKWFLYENNESMSDAIREEITKALGVEPVMIDSADFSAQTRKRLYWTNIPVLTNWEKSTEVIADIVYDDSYKVSSFEKWASTIKFRNDGQSVCWDTSGKGYYSQQNRARSKTIKMNTLPTWDDVCNIWLGGYSFRRLHPVEAERLQKLPDGYTDGAGLTDAKRVKAVGNGWTVSVIAHILNGLPNYFF